MIGVALFGIFLTPVFFFVLMRFGSQKRAGTALVQAAAAGEDGAGTSRGPTKAVPAEPVRPPMG
jgi:hypothetical protein